MPASFNPQGRVGDNGVRPQCAREFGKLQAEAEAHREFRTEVRKDLTEIKAQMAGIHDIKELIASMNPTQASMQERVEKLESSVSEMWKDRIKTAGASSGAMTVIYVLVEYLRSRYGG